MIFKNAFQRIFYIKSIKPIATNRNVENTIGKWLEHDNFIRSFITVVFCFSIISKKKIT